MVVCKLFSRGLRVSRLPQERILIVKCVHHLHRAPRESCGRRSPISGPGLEFCSHRRLDGHGKQHCHRVRYGPPAFDVTELSTVISNTQYIACLPSLKPILSFTMTGSPSASARARNYQLSRYSGRTAPGNGSKAGRGDSRNRGDHDTERLFFSAAGKVDPSGQYSPMADEISNRMTTAPPRPGMDEGGGGGYLAS